MHHVLGLHTTLWCASKVAPTFGGIAHCVQSLLASVVPWETFKGSKREPFKKKYLIPQSSFKIIIFLILGITNSNFKIVETFHYTHHNSLGSLGYSNIPQTKKTDILRTVHWKVLLRNPKLFCNRSLRLPPNLFPSKSVVVGFNMMKFDNDEQRHTSCGTCVLVRYSLYMFVWGSCRFSLHVHWCVLKVFDHYFECSLWIN